MTKQREKAVHAVGCAMVTAIVDLKIIFDAEYEYQYTQLQQGKVISETSFRELDSMYNALQALRNALAFLPKRGG